MKNLVPRVGTKINQSPPNHRFWEQGRSQDFSKERGGGGGVTEATHQLVMPTSTSILTKDKSR